MLYTYQAHVSSLEMTSSHELFMIVVEDKWSKKYTQKRKVIAEILQQ